MADVERPKVYIMDDKIVEVKNLFLSDVISKPFLAKFKMPTLFHYNGTIDLAKTHRAIQLVNEASWHP